AGLAFALLVVCAAGARAAPPAADPATAEAKKRFEKGNLHYNLGEYREALADYKEAYRLKNLPGFLFNIAQCHRKLGEFQEAINLYTAYLNQVPNPPNRADVESVLEESRAQLAAQERSAEEQRRSEAERQRLEAERQKAEAERAAALARAQKPIIVEKA